jgi:2-polyprenyl-3-methyl-5-hydroxy-6-metoxy-1,4-benzoquinol methylase
VGQGYEVEHRGVVFSQPEFRVWQCAQCGLFFKNRTIGDSELAQYYRLVDFSKWDIGKLFPTERMVLQLLLQFPAGARFLDYGCSAGRLLEQLVADYACYGYEPNIESAKEAAASGIHILEDASLTESQSETFDVVTLMDVFEHLRRPTEKMRELFALLKPGGLLILATGNLDSPVFRKNPANFYYFRNIEHLCVLGREYATYLCRILPARLVHWESLSHYDTSHLDRLKLHLLDFVYWQFQKRTLLARSVLSRIPIVRRAQSWPLPPELTCTRDHVVAAWRKGL